MSIERDPINSRPPAAGTPAASQSSPAPSTHDEPMTKTQAAYLEALCAELGETFESQLSKAEAAERIDRLERAKERAQPATAGGDGGSSIRANEAPPEDQTSSR